MKLGDFLISKTFRNNVLIALGLLVILVAGSLLFLNMYTRHAEELPVPDFRGMMVAEAEELAAKFDIKIEVIDSVFLNKSRKGSVVDQNPPPGFKVKSKRTIFLTINALQTEKVKMPNLVGISFRQAEATLTGLGLRVGRIEYLPDIAENNVLRQKFRGRGIAEGKLIEKGVAVDLVLGKGLSDEETLVPKLIGLTRKDAEEIISEYQVAVGAVICDETVESHKDSLNALIWKQSPFYDENKVIRLGTPVDIWLTLDETKLPVDTTSNNKEE